MKRRNATGNNGGMALVLAVFCAAAVLAGILLVMFQVQQAHTLTNVNENTLRAGEAAKAGIESGIRQIWGGYLSSRDTVGNLTSFIQYVDAIVPNNEDLNGNGKQDTGETDMNSDGQFNTPAATELISSASAFAIGEDGSSVEKLTAVRHDDVTGMTVTLSAEGSANGVTQTAEQTIRIAGKLFKGFDYAILANNVNCIMCHAEVTSYPLDSNASAQNYNSFDRIKVATLESLLIRPTEALSHVAGTLYTRGDVRDNANALLSAAGIASSTMKGYAFDNTTGKLTQNKTSGAMSSNNLTNATKDAQGLFKQFANLYQGYPTDEKAMTDGDLPTTFPAPFPDSNGNRTVDTTEFASVASASTGKLSGGIAYGVPSGSTYGGAALPSSGNAAATDLANSGVYNGNAILVGTAANPIVINGNVSIKGDLVMTGYVKGTGKLQVQGNTYIVGDVNYADASGKFGTAADGTTNLLSVVSGGSVLMGDYLTIRGKNNTVQESNKYPDSAYSIQVRTANKSSTVNSQKLNYGYFDPGVIDAGKSIATMVDASGATVARQGQQYSFTTSELMLFNRSELKKAVADPNYTPRFYGLRASQPNELYVYDAADEHAVKYTDTGVKTLAAYMTAKGYPLSILTKAAKHYMNPAGNWMSEDVLRKIWYNDEMSRTSRNKPVKFDGLLYSNNAIFAITRSYSRHGSYTEGMMNVRGGMVCADLGILVPGNGGATDKGLSLQYDPRVKSLMRLEDTTQVTFSRNTFRWVAAQS